MRYCSRCGKVCDTVGRYCRSCRAAYMREWRRTAAVPEEERVKQRCRATTHVLVARGVITKEPCEVCTDPKVEAHHDDYEKPEQVKWLCAHHHRMLHKAMRRGDVPRGTTA